MWPVSDVLRDAAAAACCCDCSGGDAALVEAIERDVLDRNPGVTFDDIASLDKAKQTLNEARSHDTHRTSLSAPARLLSPLRSPQQRCHQPQHHMRPLLG